MKNFSERLAELMEARGISQVDLYTELGIARRSMHNYQSGERRPPLDTVIALADYFDVSIDYLVGRTDDPARPPAPKEP